MSDDDPTRSGHAALLIQAAYRRGYLSGLKCALAMAKDYTGQGVLIYRDLLREIERLCPPAHEP